jgi:DNA-directed RNA polymerase subunit RPC12/RpoP
MHADLFPGTKPPRQKPRKLLHVCDVGVPCCADDYDYDREAMVQFLCSRCGHESEWVQMLVSEAKRGMPCPACNGDSA